jgi:hypothetical protein
LPAAAESAPHLDEEVLDEHEEVAVLAAAPERDIADMPPWKLLELS